MNVPEVVRRYAVTLFEAAGERNALAQVQGDVEGLVATLRQSGELISFLDNPLLGVQVQRQTLERLFSGKVQELTLNFLRLMAGRRRAALIPAALEAFLMLVEERAGVVSAQVRSAAELSQEQRERLRARLAAYTGKQVRLEVRVDGSLRGGLVARVGDVVFDGSVNMHLERLRRRLVGT
jgi:F-type H+-transporting ATPase subunit delta